MLRKKSLREIMEKRNKFVTLRLTEEMHKEIKEMASQESRTLCSQINYILAKYLGKVPSK